MIIEAFPGQGTKKYDSPTPELDLLDETLAKHDHLLTINPTLKNAHFLYGNSYGLFAAAVTAGVIGYAAARELAALRKQYVQKGEQESGQTGMLNLLGPKTEQIEALISSAWHELGVQVTNYNGPAATVVSGPMEALNNFKIAAMEQLGRMRATMLEIEGAYHHKLRERDAQHYAEKLMEYDFKDPAKPLISSTRPRILATGDAIRTEFWQQMFNPLVLPEVLSVGAGQGAQILVETGPGTSLKKLGERIPNHGIRLLSLEEDEEAIKQLAIPA